MNMQSLINEISIALDAYRKSVAGANDAEAREEFSRLVTITEKAITAMQTGDIAQARLKLLAFSRQVSDSFAVQPLEFRSLAQKIAEAKKLVT